MSGTYSIRIEKDYLGFCSAHFITYEGSKREALHGHNFTVRLELTGLLDENYYVLDFIQAKKILKRVCDKLDHRVLLPLENRYCRVEALGDSVSVRYEEQRFLFPAADVVLLPIPNVTSELLASYICGQLKAEYQRLGARLTAIELEVKESPGQGGIYRETW